VGHHGGLVMTLPALGRVVRQGGYGGDFGGDFGGIFEALGVSGVVPLLQRT